MCERECERDVIGLFFSPPIRARYFAPPLWPSNFQLFSKKTSSEMKFYRICFHSSLFFLRAVNSAFNICYCMESSGIWNKSDPSFCALEPFSVESLKTFVWDSLRSSALNNTKTWKITIKSLYLKTQKGNYFLLSNTCKLAYASMRCIQDSRRKFVIQNSQFEKNKTIHPAMNQKNRES